MIRIRNTLLMFVFMMLIAVAISDVSIRALDTNPTPIQTFYVPFPEDQVYTALTSIFPGNNVTAPSGEVCPNFGSVAAGGNVNTYISAAMSNNETVIYYDHWEDGFETSIDSPTQSTTEVWGDGILTNGVAPGFPDDLLDSGDVVIMQTNTPHTSLGTIDYDGGDKMSASEQISATRVAWLDSSRSLLAGGLEMYPTYSWGKEYVIPIGTDTDVGEMFQYTSATIMAGVDGTVVNIDEDADGVAETTITLDEGESYITTGFLKGGATISASNNIQTGIITGDYCAGYESRWFTLFPTEFWSSSYFSPVGTPAGAPTYVHVHNPNDTAISVDWKTSAGAQSPISVPAHSTVYVETPNSSSTHFYTNDGSIFNAFATIDSDNPNNLTHDWGFALVPELEMTQAVLVAMGLGQDPTFTGSSSENSAPIWLGATYPSDSTSTGNIDVCVDYNGNGGALFDSFAERNYDEKLSIAEMSSTRVYDADGDQTAMMMWVCDGSDAIITAVWGQDPNTASVGSPAIDVGTTLPGLSPFGMTKVVDLTNDVNDNGRFDPGDTVTYTIVVDNIGLLPIPGQALTVTDLLPSTVTYVADTTELTDPSLAVTNIADDGATIFPLDEAGYEYVELLGANEAFVIEFDATINTVPGTGSVQNQVFINGNGTSIGANAVFPVLIELGNYIWADTNLDGIQDSDEDPIAGVVVNLLDEDGNIADTVTTGADGKFLFLVTPGTDYTISIDTTQAALSGLELSPTDNTDGTDGTDSDGSMVGNDATIVLTTGIEDDLTQAFGFRAPAVTIGNFVWNDTDMDGIQDTGEDGIEGVTVELLDSDGNVVDSTTTDADGLYSFEAETNTAYTISIDATQTPLATFIIADADQTGDANDSDATMNGTDAQIAITTGTTDVDTFDFGFHVPPTVDIGNFVWTDTDMDGIQDSGEAGIPGVVVFLYDDNGDFVDSTTTASDGSYSFTVDPNTPYTISIDTAQGALTGLIPADADNPTGTDATDSDGVLDDTMVVINLTTGIANDDTSDFGFHPPLTIGDFVWHDTNLDGVQDSWEEGISGLTVELVDADGNVVDSTTTDADGGYSFDVRPNADYTISVAMTQSPIDGYVTSPADSTDGTDSTDSDAVTNGDDAEIALTTTTSDDDTSDFGFHLPPVTIGNYVWHDTNHDGIQDPNEEGIAGVTVELLDVDGNVIMTTVTGPNGEYTFDVEPNTEYSIVIDSTQPALGDVDIPTDSNNPDTDDESDSDGLPNGDDVVITLTTGTTDDLTNAFGFHKPLVDIGNYVWDDGIYNGIQDPGSQGIPNVEIQLVDDEGDVIATTTTDSLGAYTFTVEVNEDYIVRIDTTQPVLESYLLTDSNIPGDDTIDSDGVIVGDNADAPLSVGTTSDDTTDFGFVPLPIEIGDYVWMDTDQDGIQDSDEDPIEGVEVKLLDAAGNIIGSTTTDSEGHYFFVVDRNTPYTIYIDQTQTVLDGLQPSDPNNPAATDTTDSDGIEDGTSVSVDLVTEMVSDYSFGFGFHPPKQIEIGRYVWHDADMDGSQDYFEDGIGGVTVNLLDENGNIVDTTVSDPSGFYTFDVDQDTPYSISIDLTQPALDGQVPTLPNMPTTTDLKDSDGIQSGNEVVIDLTTGNSDDYSYAFGFHNPTVEIGNLVWEDDNWNGVQELTSESGMPGVMVQLQDPDGNVIATTTTDLNGEYTFIAEQNTDYVIVIDMAQSAISGKTLTRPNSIIANDNTDSDGIANGIWAEITMSTGVDNDFTNEFGFHDSAVVPVTMAHVTSRTVGNDTIIDWTTEMEVGTVGFKLYGIDINGGTTVLNDEIIVSTGTTTFDPQSYSHTVENMRFASFYIESLDIDNTAKLHGPFNVSEDFGAAPSTDVIDWESIHKENNALETSRVNELRQAQSRAGRNATGDLINLIVEEDGVYRLEYSALRAQGVDLTGVNSADIAVMNEGKSVAIYVSGNGTFTSDDYIEFYGEQRTTLYSHENVYTLAVDAAKAERVAVEANSATGTPESFYMETEMVDENNHYDFLSPSTDPWYYAQLKAVNGATSEAFAVQVDNSALGEADVSLLVNVWGNSSQTSVDPDHHLVVEVDGEQAAESFFDGHSAAQIDAVVAVDALPDGAFDFTLTLPHDQGARWDYVSIESFGIRYPRSFVARDNALVFTSSGSAFSISDFDDSNIVAYRLVEGELTRLNGIETVRTGTNIAATIPGNGSEAMYVVATEEALMTPVFAPIKPLVDIDSGKADYIMVAHPNFIAGLSSLVQHHTEDGLSVKVVDVTDIYAAYNHGVADADAIRSYLNHAYENMGTRYVLLVGGDNYYYYNDAAFDALSFVPSLYTSMSATVRYQPVDPMYGDVDDDGMPDMAIGRFPVRTTDELAVMVNKSVAFADGVSGFDKSAVTISDKYDTQSNLDFSSIGEEIDGAIPSDWNKTSIDLNDSTGANANQSLIDAINEGALMVNYTGHSGIRRWSFEDFFNQTDVDSLTNSSTPAIFAQYGCWSNYHVHPSNNTMGQSLMLAEEKGAVASLGSTGIIEARSAEFLSQNLTAEISNSGARLGDALNTAKALTAEENDVRNDVLLGFSLLGDPALRLFDESEVVDPGGATGSFKVFIPIVTE